MLQQHTRTTRGLGPVVALGLAIAAINPATGLAKPAADPVVSVDKTAISQNLVSPDARDAATSSSATTATPQNLVSPDARDAASVSSSSQSLVSPDARDAADGVVVSSPKLAPAPATDDGGIEGWNPEVVIGLAAALLMGLAGIGLLARARMSHQPRARIS